MSAGSARVAGVEKALAVPNAITRPKIGSVEVGFVPEYQAMDAMATASANESGTRELPAVDPVGEGAGDEDEQRGGRELRETEQPERQRAPGEVEHLLAEHGGEQRDGDRRAHDRREECNHGTGLRLHRRHLDTGRDAGTAGQA